MQPLKNQEDAVVKLRLNLGPTAAFLLPGWPGRRDCRAGH
jgi:hypothetical protein